MEFKVGDKVKIINTGYQYSTYTRWVTENAPSYLERFGRESNGKRGQSGKIVAKGVHGRQDGFKMLYLVEVGGVGDSENRYCLISGDGIEFLIPKKTFKIEQVIEMMREDNSRKFQSAIDSEGDYIQIEGEQIVWRGYYQSGQVFKLGLLDDLWVEYDEIEEVEPKTFQEVLEEVIDTPDTILIKMEHRFLDLDYQDLEDMLHEIAEIWFSDDISKILLEGKFYTKKL